MTQSRAAKPPAAVAGYYSGLAEPAKSTLLELRLRVLAVVPTADEVLKYKMPTFVVDGVDVCGLMAHSRHIGYYPYSGSVLASLPDLVDKYGGTKGALHLPLDKPIPKAEIRRLVKAKQQLRAS